MQNIMKEGTNEEKGRGRMKRKDGMKIRERRGKGRIYINKKSKNTNEERGRGLQKEREEKNS